MKKAFFIMGLIFLAAMPIIADNTVARWALAQVQSRETAPGEAFEHQKLVSVDAPAEFIEKERWSLKARHAIVRYATIMGNYGLGKELTASSLERFRGSALESDPLCQDMYYYQGRSFEAAGEYKFTTARTSYAFFLEQYPDNPLAEDAKQRLADLNLLVNH